MSQEIQFRPANSQDAKTIAPLVYSSGPSAFDYIFSHNTSLSALQFLEKTLQRPGGEFGFRNHRVAELDNEVVGVATSFTGKDSLSFMLVAIGQILRHYGPGAPGVMRRGLQVESMIVPPGREEFCIAHVGVSPLHRNKGIGRILMQHMIKKGKNSRCSRIILDVSAENPAALSLYESLGFHVKEKRASRFSNSTATLSDHLRMEL